MFTRNRMPKLLKNLLGQVWQSKTSATTSLPVFRPKPLVLEPRYMFDGAAVETAITGLSTDTSGTDVHDVTDASLLTASADLVKDTSVVNLASSTTAPIQIVFIEDDVPDYQQLVSQTASGSIIYVLDHTKDGLSEIASILGNYEDVSAIHIVSHGSQGSISLGATELNASNIDEYQATLTEIGLHLAQDGDILIYGCDVAEGTIGGALVNQIATLTNADVAASTDDTGAAALDGNWNLEYKTGEIDSSIFLTTDGVDSYADRLSTVSLEGMAGWVAVMFGTMQDPNNDNQAGAADTDIIGDSAHGSLYTAYSDSGTTSTADDYLYFRMRIDNPTSSTNFSGVAVVGLDVNLDGRIDLFIAVDGRNNGQCIRILDPGNGLNNSPNTTTTQALPSGWLDNNGVYAFTSSNYSVTAVSALNDPNWGTSTVTNAVGTTSPSDLTGDGKTDVFVSWRISMADLATVLATPSLVDRNGVVGPRGTTGISGFTKDTVVQYVSFTQTQSGPINGDLNGVGATYDKNATFAQLNAFTAQMSASNPVAASTNLTITDNVPGIAKGDVTFTFTFSEGVSGFDINDVNVTGGTKGVFTQVNSSTYTLVVSPISGVNSGEIGVSVAAGAGNGLTSGLITSAATATQSYDTLAPTISIDTPSTALSGTPTLTGHSDLADGSMVSIALDTDNNGTADIIYQAMVTAGAWTLNTATAVPTSGTMPTSGLTSYTKVTATATDAAGNSTSAVELNRPTVNTLSTNSTAPTITGTWTNISGDVLTVTVNGATYTLSPSGNTWSLDLNTATPTTGSKTALVVGQTYEVTATVTRSSTSVSDTTSTEITVTSTPVKAVDIAGGATATGTNTYPTITGTSSNSGGYVIVHIDPNNDGNLSDAVTYSVTTDGSGNWTLNTSSAQPISGTVPSGGYIGSIGLRATDSSGTVNDTQVLTISTPTVTIGSITSTATTDTNATVGNSGAAANYLNMTEDNAVTITGTAANGYTVDLVISDANGHSLSYTGLTVTNGEWTQAGLDLSSLDSTTLTVKATLSGTSISATDTSVTHDAIAPKIFNTTPSDIKKASIILTGGSELPNTVLTITFTPAGGSATSVDVTTDANGDWATTSSQISVTGNPSSATVTVAPKTTATDTAGNKMQSVTWTQAITANASTNSISIGTIAGDNIISYSNTLNEIGSGVVISGTTTLTGAGIPISLTITDSANHSVTLSTTSTSGAWTATLTNAQIQTLSNGPLTVKATASDAGVSIYDVALPTLSLASPTLAITDNVAGTATGDILFTFTFSENVTGFDISDISVSAGATKGTFSTIDAKTYTLLVTPPTSSSGNVTVTVNNGAAAGAVTGRSSIGSSDVQAYVTNGTAAAPSLTINTDTLASDTTPVISGTTSLSAGAPITLTFDLGDGTTLTYSAIVQTGGTWSLDVGTATPVSGTLPTDGMPVYTKVTATATNAYGNSTNAVGLNKPVVTAKLTNSSTPTISGYWTNISGDTLSVTMNGVTYSVGDSSHPLTVFGNTWSFTPSSTADGTYEVVATTTRSGTSKTDISSQEVTIDTLAGVSIVGGSTKLTNDSTPLLSGTVSDVPSGSIVTVTLDLDGNGTADVTYKTVSDASGNWQLNTETAVPSSGTFPSTGLNGSVTVKATVSDLAGNTATATQTLTVDVTPPEIAITTSSKTADTTPIITGTTDLPAGATITLVVDPDGVTGGTTYTYTAIVDSNGKWQVDTENPTANGGTGPMVTYTSGNTISLKATGTDSAGNATEANRGLTIDTAAPTLSIYSPLDWNLGNSNNSLSSLEDDTVIVKGTITNVAVGQTVVVSITDGSVSIYDTATVTSGGNWALSSLNLSALKSGTITVTASYTDSSGAEFTASATVDHDKSATVAIDSISEDTGTLADFITKDTTITIKGSATPSASVLVEVLNSVNSVVATFNVTANSSGSWQTTDTSSLATGDYTLRATVGGTAVTKAMTIIDSSAPTLVSSTPSDNSTSVSVSDNLDLTFSKNVVKGTGFISLYKSDGTLIESFDVSTGVGDQGGSLTFNGTTGISLNPNADLLAATDYYITIGTSAVRDSVGNQYAGITNSTTLNFKTAGTDTTPPTITGPSGSAGDATATKSIPENQTAVTTLSASESVTWSIVSGGDGAKFSIDSSGNLTFNAAPDYENPTDSDTNNTYIVTVKAVDGAGNFSTQQITVTVTDVDEVAPTITGPSGAAGASTATKSIPENQTAVTTLSASESVTWSIVSGGDGAKFSIDSSGNLTFNTAPDYENPTDSDTNNTYIVTVKAVDGAGNFSTQQITVTVTDVDEIAPTITGPSGAAGASTATKSIPENQTAVTTLSASESVTWSIVSGGDGAKFSIDSSGNLTFNTAPDYENPTDSDTNNTYIVTVKAVDGAGNFSTQQITVTVTDVDEIAPTITGPSGAAGASTATKSIPENQTAVTTLSASESVTWSIVSGGDGAKFSIDSSGNLTFNTAPDYENPTDSDTNNTYIVTVKAIDGAGNFSTQQITVTVTDVDEIAPTITGPSGSAGDATATKSIPENQTAVTTLSASESVTWSIVSGGDGAKFSIDSSGNLTFNAAPDYENPTDSDTNNTYIVTVKAVDGAGNFSTQQITVTVTDVDEIAPTITGPSGAAGASTATKSIPENQTAVTTLSASESVTWSIVSGGDGAKFSIDSSGNLSFNTAPDYENPTDSDTNNTYIVTVKAVDGAGNFSTQQITVTVTDVDEIAPTITGPSGAAGASTATKSIPENQTAVTTLSASESVTWSIVSGGDGAKFSIDSSGNLSFNTAPDYENPTDSDTNNTYIVTVKAVDGAGNFSTQQITVTVTDVDENTPPIVPTSPVVEPQTTPPATTETPAASNDTTTSPTQEATTDAPFSNIIAASVDTNFENTAPVSTLPDLSMVQSFNQRSSIEDNLTQVGVGAFRIPVIKADEVNLMVYNGVQDQIYEKNADVDFKLPADAFVHTQEDAVVKLTAKLSDGKALPTWLHFDATSGRFQGTPPADVDSIIEIVVTARDNDGRTASTVFKIRVGKIATNKLSFNEQVLQAKQGSPISRLQSASPIKIRA